jgi:transposase
MKMIRAKTDKQDASMLFDYGQINELKAWIPSQEYSVKLKNIYTSIDLMHKHKTAYTNQLEAFSYMKSPECLVLKEIKKQLKSIDNSITKLELKAQELVQANAPALYTVLTGIPSIGKKTAIMLIATTNEFSNFKSSKQLSSYLGICPRVYQSGTSVRGKGKICKMGMGQMRSSLFMCSLSAIRYNKACKEMYERLTQNGKPKKVALVAVMNKLIKQAFAIGTRLEKYNEICLN